MKYYIIGGGTAAGKTTITEKLKELWLYKGYTSDIISVDMFYKTTGPTTDFKTYNFDLPSALEVDLFYEKLLELYFYKKAYLPVYDFNSCKLEHDQDYVNKPEILVIEGILIFEMLYNFKEYVSSATLAKFKLSMTEANEIIEGIIEGANKVFVTTDEDLETDTKIRLHRKIERDIIERNRSSLDTIEMWNNNSYPAHFKYV